MKTVTFKKEFATLSPRKPVIHETDLKAQNYILKEINEYNELASQQRAEGKDAKNFKGFIAVISYESDIYILKIPTALMLKRLHLSGVNKNGDVIKNIRCPISKVQIDEEIFNGLQSIGTIEDVENINHGINNGVRAEYVAKRLLHCKFQHNAKFLDYDDNGICIGGECEGYELKFFTINGSNPATFTNMFDFKLKKFFD